ncbi:MAG: hypothetical protein M3R08_07650, partial [Bacteroidota bacterium]|nr:hypothetical protein [Bacteroidota bacterium]
MDRIKAVLDLCLERGLTFAAFRKKERFELWISFQPGLQTCTWKELDEQRNVFVIAPFRVDPEMIQFFSPDLVLDLAGPIDLSQLEKTSGSSSDQIPEMIHMDQNGHSEAIKTAQQKMQTGALEKVVLSRTLQIAFDRDLIADLFL